MFDKDVADIADAKFRAERNRIDAERAFLLKQSLFDDYDIKFNSDFLAEKFAVFTFTKSFGNVEYRYAVLYGCGIGFYLTGRRNEAFSKWSDFVHWLISGEDPVAYHRLVRLYPIEYVINRQDEEPPF